MEKRTVSIDHDKLNVRKEETATKFGVPTSTVQCDNCGNWFCNRGKGLNPTTQSRCMFKKQMTGNCQWCTGWTPTPKRKTF